MNWSASFLCVVVSYCQDHCIPVRVYVCVTDSPRPDRQTMRRFLSAFRATPQLVTNLLVFYVPVRCLCSFPRNHSSAANKRSIHYFQLWSRILQYMCKINMCSAVLSTSIWKDMITCSFRVPCSTRTTVALFENQNSWGDFGMSVTDRLTAGVHTLTGQHLAKVVAKASSHEVMGPKKKHLESKHHVLKHVSLFVILMYLFLSCQLWLRCPTRRHLACQTWATTCSFVVRIPAG